MVWEYRYRDVSSLILLQTMTAWCITYRPLFDPQKVLRARMVRTLVNWSGEKVINSFVLRLREGLLGRYFWLSTCLYRSRRCSMRSLIGSLSLAFALTACAPLSKQDAVLGDAGKKAEQQEEYDTWWQTLTPEQRRREIERQHERALMP